LLSNLYELYDLKHVTLVNSSFITPNLPLSVDQDYY
jgi:hypothetical protein